jgi:hypothetical protein
MTLSAVVNLVTAATLLAGLLFGVVQLRQFRKVREREAALELLRTFQSARMARALRQVFELPPGLSGQEIEDALGDDIDLVYGLLTTWESIGVLVFRGEVELDMVEDFFSGPIRVSWERLEPLIRTTRQRSGRETISEWFQWLADRMAEREAAVPPRPAHIEHRDWRPGGS